ILFCFFFSSRRRHTRSKRDWSSDVCSSDLTGDDVLGGGGHEHVTLHCEQGLLADRLALGITRELTMLLDPLEHVRDVQPPRVVRSEERRVGKEGRGEG